MKHTTFLAALVAIAMVSCTKDTGSIEGPAETSSKFIQFSLAQSKDYFQPEYQGLSAGVTIAVSKVTLATGQSTLLWDSSIAIQPITNYPVMHHPFTFGKVFHDIDDHRETLSYSCWIVYRDRNEQLTSEGKNQFIATGNSASLILVNP